MISRSENTPVLILGLTELCKKFFKVNPPADELMRIFNELDTVNIKLDLKYFHACDQISYQFSPMSLTLSMCDDIAYLPVIQALLDKGATTTVLDLYLMSKPGTYGVIHPLQQELFERFDVKTVNDSLDEQLNTILHKLAYTKKIVPPAILKFLLENGADVTAVEQGSGNQKLALRIAADNRKYSFVAMLLPYLPTQLGLDTANYFKWVYQTEGIYHEKAYQSLKSLSSPDEIIEAEDFEKAINKFLLENNFNNISDMFDVEKYPNWNRPGGSKSYFDLLIKSFYSNPSIAKYLARNTISFDDKLSPKYHQFEAEFYRKAEEYNDLNHLPIKALTIPLRSDSQKSPFILMDEKKDDNQYAFFYTTGATPKTERIYLEMVKESMIGLSESCIKLILPKDMYHMGDLIQKLSQTSLAKNDRGFSYVISGTSTHGVSSGHIFSTLSIINTHEKKVHCHLVFNSWINNDYFERVSRGINKDKIASPVFDGSLSIQINDSDANCALYTTRICKALYEVISSNTELQIRLEDMDVSKIADWESIRPDFHHCLKEKLTECYQYNEDIKSFEVRPYDQLKEFNLQMRWRAGNRFIMNKHQKSIDIIEENHEALEKITSFSMGK
ncbi:MAG: hypothetical protein H0U57_05670 [Tatlockia sp.]|nr:hypothetical protein [Tatlockia sp.]